VLTLAATLVVAAALAAPAAAYEVVTVADGGALAGVVRFAGAPPRLEPLAVTRNHDVCGDRKESEALVPMAGEKARVRNSDPILHNPHGFLGKPTVFNLALPNRDQTIDITRRLTRPGVIRVVCDAHPHMLAWMIVHDSPYYAVTDERGAFRIDGILPGRYKVTMWHEGFRPRGLDRDGRPRYDGPRTVTRGVTIAPRATATIDFELK
jgi:hypothetical protein